MWRLFQWIIELCQAEKFGTITITLQRGRVTIVHFDEALKMDELPVRDKNAGLRHLAGLPL